MFNVVSIHVFKTTIAFVWFCYLMFTSRILFWQTVIFLIMFVHICQFLEPFNIHKVQNKIAIRLKIAMLCYVSM